MLRLLLLVTSIAVLGGCASQDRFDYKPPQCYTDQKISVDNGEVVNSKVELECTDRPGQQARIARAGIDKTCEEFTYDINRWGKLTKQRGLRCEKLDGTWEILNINGFAR
mgnify:CR=1 FL=1